MPTIGDAIDAALRVDGAARGVLQVPGALQSWPGIVHGGAVVALLDAAAARLCRVDGPRLLEGRLTSSLPLETPLDLDAEPWEDGLTLTVRQAAQVVSSGTIRPFGAKTPSVAPWAGGAEGLSLPMSDDCLACGARNPLGLRVALHFDDDGVWARLTPGAEWRASGAGVHPAVAPVLLDEVAWWLGALVAQDGGLTNRITVALVAAEVPRNEPLIAAGRFADVTPIDKKRTFWRTECALSTAAGTPLASASIVFRGGAEYSAQQMRYFRQRAPGDTFRRMFPNHAG